MIYIASKVRHAHRWREFRSIGVPIISTWIDVDDEEADFSVLWPQFLEEVVRAEYLVAYREEGETWKGAWIEIGAALVSGRHVIVVGAIDPDWTFLKHPRVSYAETVGEAFRKVMKL